MKNFASNIAKAKDYLVLNERELEISVLDLKVCDELTQLCEGSRQNTSLSARLQHTLEALVNCRREVEKYFPDSSQMPLDAVVLTLVEEVRSRDGDDSEVQNCAEHLSVSKEILGFFFFRTKKTMIIGYNLV